MRALGSSEGTAHGPQAAMLSLSPQKCSHLSGPLQAVSDVKSLHTRSLLGSHSCNQQKCTAHISAAPVQVGRKETDGENGDFESYCNQTAQRCHGAVLPHPVTAPVHCLNYDSMSYVCPQSIMYLPHSVPAVQPQLKALQITAC